MAKYCRVVMVPAAVYFFGRLSGMTPNYIIKIQTEHTL